MEQNGIISLLKSQAKIKGAALPIFLKERTAPLPNKHNKHRVARAKRLKALHPLAKHQINRRRIINTITM